MPKSPKPCPAGQERNHDTGRCRKSCEAGKIRNPVTGRCINKPQSPRRSQSPRRARSPRRAKSPKFIKASDQDPEKFYCTNPFIRDTATTKDRVKSCTKGGIANSVNKESYLKRQVCVGSCFKE